MKETETIDKLFLELSQFTTAKTAREIELRHAAVKLLAFCARLNGIDGMPVFAARESRELVRSLKTIVTGEL